MEPKPQDDGPLVSVVVPCIDRAHILRPTLDSILAQDYPHIECIVVDGGSTDGTLDILREYGDRIRWISEPDRGHGDAINKGWGMARGEVLAWLNADDLWEVPHAVSIAVDYLGAHPEADVVYGDCAAVDLEGCPVGMSHLRPWNLAYAVEYCDHCIPQPAAFMRRAILEKVGFVDAAMPTKPDHDLWLRIGLVGNIHYTPQLLARARSTGGYQDEKGDMIADVCVRLIERVYASPHLPPSLEGLRRRAISNAHLRGTQYAWRQGGHHRAALRHLLQGVRHDPTNARPALGTLRRLIAEEIGARLQGTATGRRG